MRIFRFKYVFLKLKRNRFELHPMPKSLAGRYLKKNHEYYLNYSTYIRDLECFLSTNIALPDFSGCSFQMMILLERMIILMACIPINIITSNASVFRFLRNTCWRKELKHEGKRVQNGKMPKEPAKLVCTNLREIHECLHLT